LSWAQSVVKISGAYELQPSFRVLVQGVSEDASDDEVLWVKPQQPLPPVWDNVAIAQQRQFEGTALADSAARVAAAHVSDPLSPARRRSSAFVGPPSDSCVESESERG
jgi:hypothetical protein